MTYDQNVSDNGKRTIMQLAGIPNLLLKHATLKINRASGNGTKITIGAYHNGMGGIYMLMSIKYQTKHWDIVH